MNLSLPTLDWNACDVLLTFCVILNWVQSEHLAMWLFSGYRRELALFYEVFLFWFVVTTRVAMSQADLLITWPWNVEQVNIGCRSFSWLLNIWIKCGGLTGHAILKWYDCELIVMKRSKKFLSRTDQCLLMCCKVMERNKHGLFAIMFEMDACCVVLFSQTLLWHCNLLLRRWNEHCLNYMKPLQLRLSHLDYALYSVPDLSPYNLEC